MPWTPDLPYPEREHLEMPASVAERIHDELQHSGNTTTDVRNALGIELDAIYEETALGQYLSFYASALIKAEKLKILTTGEEQKEDSKYRPEVVYAGSLLAVRTILNGLSYDLRTRILNFAPLWRSIEDIQALSPEGVQAIEQMIELIESKDEMMGKFPDELQFAIMAAAEQYCAGGDVAIAKQREEDFILGFIASTNVTVELRNLLDITGP